MYPVNNYYKEAIASRTVEYRWYGSITFKDNTSVSFDEKSIDQNKSRITRQCVSGKNLEIGNVFSSELRLSLRDNDSWTVSSKMYNYHDAVVTITFSVKDKNGNTQSVPCGVFTVSEVTRTYHTVSLVAYDNANKLTKKTENTFSGSRTPYQAISKICEDCDVVLGTTQAEIEALPNGDRTDIKLSVYKKGSSYKTMLGNVCMLLGANAVVNRSGQLIITTYDNENVRSISAGERYSSSYADFIGLYNKVYLTNKNGDVDNYFTFIGTNYRALSMNLGRNILLNSYSKDDRELILYPILMYFREIKYSPCDVAMPVDPSIDVGDMVSLVGGEISGTYTETLDTSVEQDKTYYELVNDVYTPVVPVGDEDPSEEGWYEVGISILATKIEMPFYGQMKIVSEAGNYEVEIDNHATKKEQDEQTKEEDDEEEKDEIRDDITEINNQITDLTARATIFYVYPYSYMSGTLSDGSEEYALRFRFTCENSGDAISFYSMVAFTIETTLSNNVYGDCNLTVKYLVDGTQTKTAIHTYGDGNAILTLNGCVTDLTAGEHTFDVKFAISGGSMS